MTWERALFALFDDLEQQAEGLALTARDSEVAELGRAEYSRVDLESRLHGSVGRDVACALLGGLRVRGRLERAGRGWFLLLAGVAGEAQGTWVVNAACVTRVTGLGPRALAPDARGVAARLGLASVLRRLAESREPVVLVRADGGQTRGRIGRAGADFVELVGDGERGGDGVELVPLPAIAALRSA